MLSVVTTSLANNANTLYTHRDECEAATGYVLPPLSAYCQRSAQASTSSFCRVGCRLLEAPFRRTPPNRPGMHHVDQDIALLVDLTDPLALPDYGRRWWFRDVSDSLVKNWWALRDSNPGPTD